MADEMQFWKQGYSIASLESFSELANSKQCFADDKVCVVGLFGNGRSGVQGKAFYANSAVERNVFQVENFFKMTNSNPCEIEIFHDVEQRTLYLHLITVHDGAMLYKLCEVLHRNIPFAESYKAWQHEEYQYAKALLFMFSVCHIMVLMHPTQIFDVSYIRLFKLVANTRQQLITILSQELSSVEGIHDIWKQTGRPCIPRLLCSFQQNKNSQLLSRNVSEVESNPDSYASRTKIKSQAPAKSPLTNLQHALEDQVYSIMRKSRLLGSLSSSSLFTVTSSHNFVHVQAAEISRSADALDILLKKFPIPAFPDSFRSMLFPKAPRATTTSNGTSTNTGHVLFRDFLREQIDNLMTGDGRDGLAEGRRGTHVEVPTIREWAKVCVAVFGYLMSERSNDNNHLTTLAANLDLEMKFSDARCRKVLPVATSAYLDNLASHYPKSVHINQLNQALRVFAMNARGPAYEKYVMQLQDDCNKMWMNGRQLCEVRSLKGRHCIYPFHIVPGQSIEDNPLIDKSTISCKPHSSRITSLCACNCGRTQAQREDPFDLKAANYDFYQTMEEKCCSTLVHFSFPCYPYSVHEKPATTPPVLPVSETTMSDQETSAQRAATFSAASVRLNKDAKEFVSTRATSTNPASVAESPGVTDPASAADPASLADPASVTNPPSVTNPSFSPEPSNVLNPVTSVSSPASVPNPATAASAPNPMSSLLSEGFQSMSELESNYQKSATSLGFHGNSSAGGTEHLSGDTYQGEDDEIRRPSSKEAAEYLECMLSSELTGDRMPLFCSWSLCRLGNANTYQVSKGLEQQGFFPGSNFLLPWDIPLLNENQAGLSSYIDGHVKHPGVKTAGVEAWPAPNELPNANSNTALPLFQSLVYASRQCTDYKVNPLPICVAPASGSKGNAARNQRRQYPTVRAYIGNEYECTRGHRFICSADDKMVKANNSGVVKETAIRLVNSDMPLYFPCPCRTTKPFLAQLTRLFVVTPESPILITLNPRVQPAPAPCPVFFPGIKSGITLPPASLCVLRLPFVYVGLKGPISHPADNQPLMNSRLLRGTYGVMATERLLEDKDAWN